MAKKMIQLSNGTDNLYPVTALTEGTLSLTATQQSNARANIDANALVVDIASFNSLPKTVTNSAVTSDMVVAASTLGTPSAQTGDWTVTTSAGSLTISGTISGSTTLKLVLVHSA